MAANPELRFADQLRELRYEVQRQIIYGVVAEVFERLQRRYLYRSR